MQFSTEFANFINFAIIMEKSMIQVEFNVQAKRAMFHPGCLLENKGNKILLKAVICKACAMIFLSRIQYVLIPSPPSFNVVLV